MRFLTTLLLIILVMAGAGLWFFWDDVAPRVGLLPIAKNEITGAAEELAKITPESLKRIELNNAKLVHNGSAWTLPGEWPTRTAEVDALVNTLTNLSSRFQPLPWGTPAEYGMSADDKPLAVKATVKLPTGERTYTLTFGEPDDGENRFTRPTYLRVDDRPEVLRMAPGLIDQFRKGRDDFLRRQLFPNVVRVKFSDANRPAFGGENELPPPAQAVIDAAEVAVAGPDGAWTLKKTDPSVAKPQAAPVQMNGEKLASKWQLAAPIADRVDPDKLRGVLAAVPDLWAEAFVAETDPAKTGLDKPERTVTVKAGGRDLTVQIGNVSRVKETRPTAPPPANPFAPPPPPPIPVREEYRYAKLPNNPQVFEVRADKFADLFVKPADLRDAKLARFRPADVKRLELTLPDRKLVFTREKESGGEERWKIVEPVAALADGSMVNELLDRLADLQARGPDVIDAADRKLYGLADGDKFTTATLTLTEEEPGETAEAPKTTTHRTLTFHLGKTDDAKKKLSVQLAGTSRVNAVADDLMKLAERPVLAYRGKRVIDGATGKLGEIAIERPADPFTLAQKDGAWSLVRPVAAKADGGKAVTLANDLARLEAAEFVNFTPTPEELKKYGLDNTTLKATVTFIDSTPAKTLLVGAAREGKPEFYAKLADSPEVFAVRNAIKEALDQSSLALRPLQLWQVAGMQVQAIEVDRGGERFKLSRDGAFWKISGPFDATAFIVAVQPLLDVAAAPKAERFESHGNDELAKFGLDKPATTMRVTLKPDRPDDPVGVKELLIGKPVAEGQPARFAKLGDQPGVFVFGPALAEATTKTALDLLDRKLLAVDPSQITRVEGTGPGGPWSAKRDGDRWTLDSLNPPAAGDRAVFGGLLNALADLRALRFAAYAPQDLAKFGLDKPTATLTISTPAGDKPVTHTVALGGPVEGDAAARYARVDGGQAVAILGQAVVDELSRGPLDLADRGVFSFDPRALVSVRRQSGDAEILLERKDGAWQIARPQAALGDDPALSEMAERLSSLRAVKVAVLGVKDLKPFGLDAPAATFTLTLNESGAPPRELVLKVGRAADGGRYAQAGGDTVFVLPDSNADPLATRLLADPIKFRDRSMARFSDADRLTVTYGGRAVTFTRSGGAWKMTAPVTADAESADLDELVALASRLRADELVADKPADLAPYGLAQPEAELRFFKGDAEMFRLLVGKREADGRAFVKPAGADVVAKLDAGLTGRVLAEFRKRSLPVSLDAAQADTLVINAGTGGLPLALTKTGAGWQAGDRPAKAEAVSDVIATLAGLRAERFVVDDKADLKLYGLDPPERVIVAKTRGGQTTTLHVGRFEGDSKRVYLTIPGAGWVAVLSEVDSAKLLKPAAEFR